ncbi:MAG: hypothetical protein IK086_00065 [Clostridia bacterium]|nr:hypothetical protein [Clostridia bacterium]
MKNSDILLDAIGNTDEKLIPQPDKKRKRRSALRLSVIGGACAAAIIALIIALPWVQSKKATIPHSGTDGSAMLLAKAVYPQMPEYPDETKYSDWDAFESAYSEWTNARMTLRKQSDDYKESYGKFFLNSMRTFLNKSDGGNTVYSPLSLYMALGMSAEITGGNSRQQILNALAQSDIDTMRSHAKSIWQANYMNDGMAKCVIANSLWTNNNFAYNQNTVNTVSDTYYSSVFSGDPATEQYNKLLRDWLNEQTDGLLTDYVSGIKMNPMTVLAIASTVNYSGKWNSQFSSENTEISVFHTPGGDVECDFLNAERIMEYYYGDHFSSISLGLENNGHMKLILPDEGYTPYDLLNDRQVEELLLSEYGYKNSKFATVNISIPKFDVSSSIDLRDGLDALGIKDVFDAEKSDFAPLTDVTDNIRLTKAEQDTRVIIDEEGCKASSMTIMMCDGTAMPEDYAQFILNRPFIFEIMSETGSPLFIGVVNNPVK